MTDLILPAGNLEKLKTAVAFGADGVYFGGKDYSLRAQAGNFSWEEMQTAVEFLHTNNKKANITVNIIAHNEDIVKLPAYLEKLEELKVDSLIISDLGILQMAKKYAPSIGITVSTQANTCNYEAALFFEDLGVKRIVLARELNLDEINAIRQKVKIELEVFVHGAMCVSYSGRCLLSAFMTGRDANQGACAHPCRYSYYLVEEKRLDQFFQLEEDDRGSYILNSRDLCLLEFLPQLLEIGVDAFKVEGRMKSPLYVASVASVYRQALDTLSIEGKQAFDNLLPLFQQELNSSASRPFTTGFITGKSLDMQDPDNKTLGERTDFCGMVVGYDDKTRSLLVKQRGNFGLGEQIEFFAPNGEQIVLELKELSDLNGNQLDRARHPLQIVAIPFEHSLPEFTILRRRNAD